MSSVRRALLIGPALLVGMIVTSGPTAVGAADDLAAPIVFSGEAAASGMRWSIEVHGAPLSNTPFDVGGPVATAQLDTIGGSNGFAALPFPGTLFLSGPGLAVGLLNQQGLPVPSPPPFPYYVMTDNTTPEAESGSGPYHLKSTTSPTKADALARSGFDGGGQANLGLAAARSTVEALPGGTGAVATAVSTAEMLTAGPLTIGKVTSTVTVTLDPAGAVTPKTNLDVAGVRIAGVPASVGDEGVQAAGAAIPLTAEPALVAALEQAGIKAEMVAARPIENGAVAPAVRIVLPVPTPGFGNGTGKMTIVLGGASAAFSRFVPLPAVEAPPAIDSPAPSPAGEAPAPLAGEVAADLPAAPDVVAPMRRIAGSPSPLPAPVSGEARAELPQQASPPETTLAGQEQAAPAALSVEELGEQFDISHLYLVAALLGAGALVLSQLIRFLGVRTR